MAAGRSNITVKSEAMNRFTIKRFLTRGAWTGSRHFIKKAFYQSVAGSFPRARTGYQKAQRHISIAVTECIKTFLTTASR